MQDYAASVAMTAALAVVVFAIGRIRTGNHVSKILSWHVGLMVFAKWFLTVFAVLWCLMALFALLDLLGADWIYPWWSMPLSLAIAAAAWFLRKVVAKEVERTSSRIH